MTTPKKTANLSELGDFLDPILAIPYRGTAYEVQPVDAKTGLRLHKLLSAGISAAQGGTVDPATIELVSDDDEGDFYESVLGETYQQLVEAGASSQAVKIIASTAFIWHTQDFTTAKAFWDAGGKAPAPNRAQRRTATQTRTGAANTTQKRASRTGTSTPKAKPQAKD